MAQQQLNLKTSVRTAGKHFARTLRKELRIPAVVYGPKTKSTSIDIAQLDAIRCSKHGFENTFFTLQSDDKEINGLKVMRRAVEIHPVSRLPIHIDFLAPDMTAAVRVNVEIRFVGKAEGVKSGGVFNTIRRDVEVECLPLEIPEFFEVDVTNLALDESMHVSDIKFPENVKLMTSPTETIANVAMIKEEVAAPVAAASTDAAPAAAAGAPAAPGAAPAAAAAPAKK